VSGRPRLAARARLRWDELDRRWLILLPERGLSLNESAAAIARLLDGERTVEEIVARLAGGGDAARIDGDVRAFLGELHRRALLEWVEA
jgi:pyrroloquinoline quinone biosynthesis protein D